MSLNNRDPRLLKILFVNINIINKFNLRPRLDDNLYFDSKALSLFDDAQKRFLVVKINGRILFDKYLNMKTRKLCSRAVYEDP